MAESQDVIEREEGAALEVVADAGPPAQLKMMLDRSRCHLRLPANLVTECLRFAHALSYSRSGIEGTGAADSELVKQLREADVIVDDDLDPQAADLLRIANQASLVINVELRFGSDTSSSTVWATPRQAIVSASIDPAYADFRPVDVLQLPHVVSELMVARPPDHVGDAPISVATKAVAEAEAVLHMSAQATKILTEAGLSSEQAQKVLDFHDSGVRRWRINSTWSTDQGQDSSELRGIDAGPNGQWLVAMTGNRDSRGQLTFTPQGHGDVMRAIRSLMPKNWVGTPLKNPSLL